MEQSFPLEMFRKKRNTFRRSPLFPFLPKRMTGISLNHLRDHTHGPCSLVRHAVYFPKLPVERTIPFDSTTVQLFFSYVLFHLEENSHRFFHSNGKRSKCRNLFWNVEIGLKMNHGRLVPVSDWLTQHSVTRPSETSFTKWCYTVKLWFQL